MASNCRNPILPLIRSFISRPPHPQGHLVLPFQQSRHAATSKKGSTQKRSADRDKATKKKKKTSTVYRTTDLKDAEQFALCDAMRYIQAFEVGRTPTTSKYELHLKFRTLKNGPVVRNRMRLPHPVDTSARVCVICPPDSKQAAAARAAGAALVGEEEVFEKVKAGEINFERCLCHVDSTQKLNKSGVGRVLGPRGLMPSAKYGTVVKDVAAAVRESVGGSEYRERMGVLRMAVGQLAHSPEELQRNIKAFMTSVKHDCALLSDRITKQIHEVVLSSTNSPGFSLNGEFRSQESLPTTALSNP